ncbi:flagellar basal-body rod protein FlgC [Terriglobus roseus DSM 18391]|uniref:Flagellar basal-body rod protein FlgC n=1 Tax=Terriglobus roseus (strain DSM 18391 / NRRL B-41598 / KBS 63) TaxID=926566 RepID=I3ZFU9_TERRK|nr:flagellar basal body rod protein FlgC [Terriglobus roseus]AFL88117.1 flagellar basal-body rod protein FlgC [Terriglobus roseus DSM 18391]
MNLFGVMEISSSALRAQRVRAEVVAVNMANAETTRTEGGIPYQRQSVILQTAAGTSFAGAMKSFGVIGDSVAPAGGVEVASVISSTAPALRRYDPSHPDADGDGYVSYPDISPVTEMVDLMGASRSYGLNASAVQAEKGMLAASLDLLK